MTIELNPDRFQPFYSHMNHFAHRAMFAEMQMGYRKGEELPEPIYTLKQFHKPGLISAYQLYMESADEYEAALKICPTLHEWERLCKTKWFVEGHAPVGFEGIKVWREHMRMRDESLAKRQLIATTREGNVTAAKALLAESKVKKPAGRPNKKQDPEKAKLAIVKDFEKKRESRR